ncbi:MAG TPA: exodeoxyribonuclease VII large subunit [Acidimicrobiia bacterium]|nr:exodeoxyribonuclease VII large subunit [Acidimicrobiia bacterium]
MTEQPSLLDPEPGPPTLSVAELNQTISRALGETFPAPVWVRGEVQALHVSRNQHTYFELVEKHEQRDQVRAAIRVALFRDDRPGVNRALRDAGLRLADGVEVRIRARVDFWPPAGRLQLVMTAIDPSFTVGRLAADRDRILRALAAEGVLRRNAALPMPVVPLRVGLVTSGGSAAYRDFVHELEATGYAFRVAHCDVRVQGAAASRRLVWALRRLAREQLDVIVVVRGGGARSDLAPFDTEMVARAITEMPVPVLTGIGHETDRTVADEVAHTSVKTPTAAAALLVELVNDYVERLAYVTHRVSMRARGVCAVARREVSGVARRVSRVVPASLDREIRMLDAHRRRAAESGQRGARRGTEAVDGRHDRVVAAARRLARVEEVRVEATAARLRALDPRRVLERGYTITRDAQGRAVRTAIAAAAGALLVTETADGEIRSRVEDG